MAGERLKILLAGMIAGQPRQGGATWAVLQYVAGLSALGHEVMLVEPLWADADLSPAGEIDSYFRSLPLLEGRAALLAPGGQETVGLSFERLRTFASNTDVLLNVSGMLRDERLLASIPVRAFLDLDPGFNQIWHKTGVDMGMNLHTHFVTVGQNIGNAGCRIPTCGRSWLHTLPPVALDLWPLPSPPPANAPFTSVGHWRSYGSIEHDDLHYGQRAHSLRELIELPSLCGADFLLALGIHPEEISDLAALGANGWNLVDPDAVAASPSAYADFIRSSMAEFSVAKRGYVVSRSGWFSDRSVCYLASGRPVVTQETGFEGILPEGKGLLAFEDMPGAVAAVEDVRADWACHSEAARQLAEDHFDGRKVLRRLLELLGSHGG